MNNRINGFLVFGFIICMIFMMSCENMDKYDENSKISNVSLLNVNNVVNDPIKNCIDENIHQHDNGTYYSGHYNNDGHEHYGLMADNACSITSCNEIALHRHNGTHYSGHYNDDGHRHHESISVCPNCIRN